MRRGHNGTVVERRVSCLRSHCDSHILYAFHEFLLWQCWRFEFCEFCFLFLSYFVTEKKLTIKITPFRTRTPLTYYLLQHMQNPVLWIVNIIYIKWKWFLQVHNISRFYPKWYYRIDRLKMTQCIGPRWRTGGLVAGWYVLICNLVLIGFLTIWLIPAMLMDHAFLQIFAILGESCRLQIKVESVHVQPFNQNNFFYFFSFKFATVLNLLFCISWLYGTYHVSTWIFFIWFKRI